MHQFLTCVFENAAYRFICRKRNADKNCLDWTGNDAATRPRVLLAPLQVGLGVQLHHLYASCFLIDTLHKHGFCCSYNEVHQFEQNALLSYGTDIPNHSTQFVQ